MGSSNLTTVSAAKVQPSECDGALTRYVPYSTWSQVLGQNRARINLTAIADISADFMEASCSLIHAHKSINIKRAEHPRSFQVIVKVWENKAAAEALMVAVAELEISISWPYRGGPEEGTLKIECIPRERKACFMGQVIDRVAGLFRMERSELYALVQASSDARIKGTKRKG